MPTFATPEPISVTIEIVGDARITANDRTDTVVTVRPRDATKPDDLKAAAETMVDYVDGRLLIKTPRYWTRYTPFGAGREAVEVIVEVPTGTRVDATSALGDIYTAGELGACHLKSAMGRIRVDHTGDLWASTGHGDITVDSVTGNAEIKTGSGAVRIGTVDGPAVIKNANGATTIGEATGEVRVKAANGNIAIDRAHTSVTTKTANGNIRVGDVRDGTIVLETAAGELEVGVHEGIAAYLDLHARFGRVRNALDDTDTPVASGSTVEVRARTSAGDIVIRRATTTERTRAR